MEVILYAIPIFLVLIALELLTDWRKGTGYYRTNDAITSLNIGILSRLMTIVHQLIPFTFYALVYDKLAMFTLPESPWVWVGAFIIYDFFYYWKHRMGHEMSVLWASHVVHHSSEDYNLTTALRQTSGAVFTWIFFLPMAVMGVEPVMLVTVAALNLVYQFWVHTRHIKTLGWMEAIFVTPSNHRVHHAQNRVYIDKNYGGVFIIWDRLFGTFMPELDEEPVVFGIRGALKSFNPVWANLQVYSQLAKDSYHTASWKDKFKVWFGRTGWRPADVTEKFPLNKRPLSEFTRFDPKLSPWLSRYCLIQHIGLLGMTLYLLVRQAELSGVSQAILSVAILVTAVQTGLILQQVKLAIALEAPRLLSMPVLFLTAGFEKNIVLTLAVASVISLIFLTLAVRQAFPSKALLLPEEPGAESEPGATPSRN
ncbi:sterol desaturase family protein [Alteromonas sp. CYL-A6]|uniref:sterol desaturase family protein n=1 Tax=Alteromonas nitratireducens TaxID=3390813 RepID=UPI0034BCEE60